MSRRTSHASPPLSNRSAAEVSPGWELLTVSSCFLMSDTNGSLTPACSAIHRFDRLAHVARISPVADRDGGLGLAGLRGGVGDEGNRICFLRFLPARRTPVWKYRQLATVASSHSVEPRRVGKDGKSRPAKVWQIFHTFSRVLLWPAWTFCVHPRRIPHAREERHEKKQSVSNDTKCYCISHARE
jgi:hypothetical protein